MIGAVVLGALSSLDRTAFGQTLLAHPLVVGVLSAWWMGDPVTGLRGAVVLMLASVSRLPVGESRVRDWTVAAVVLPWWAGVDVSAERWGAALLLAFALAWVSGRSIDAMRRWNGRAIERWRARPNTSPTGLHLALTAFPALRGALVVAVAIPVGLAVLDWTLPRLGAAEHQALQWFWELAPFALLPLLWRFHAGVARPLPQWTALLVGAAGMGIVAVATRWFP